MSDKKENKIQNPKFKQSETVIIKRSLIKLHPKNVKKHSVESIKQQKKNFKDVGFLGGLVWNSVTGNLISGHKRLQAIDLYYGNSIETPVDYDVKVEKIELTEKHELEQLIYMDARGTNTQQDINLIANLIPDIDYKAAGLDDIDLKLMDIQMPSFTGSNEEIKEDFKSVGADYQQRKENLKQVKKDLKKGLAYSQNASYVTLSFDNYQNKAQFLDTYGFRPDSVMVKGEEFFDKLNN